MASRDQEHRISIPDHNNAGGSGVSVGPGFINEEDVCSLPIEPADLGEEWIREVEDKIVSAFEDSTVLWHSDFKDETGPKICMLPLRDSQPRLETKGGLSQPSVVTIGPFHRQDRVSISDKEKWMIVGLMNLLCGLDLASCLVKIKNQVANARNSYSNLDVSDQSSGFKDDKSFAEMLLLDSYFILFMLTIKLRKGPTDYTLMPPTLNKFTEPPLKLFQDDHFKFLDIIFNKDDIALDLLILDNQIPFFVIEELLKELESEKPLHEYALEFFETIHPRSAQHCKDKNISPPEFLHLLDLFHWSRVPQNKYTLPRQLDSIDWVPHTPNAMELRESATVFEKKTSGSSLDITFQRRRFKGIIGVLDIPELHFRNYSSLIFYNLIAFEIQSSSRGRCTMAFSALMRNLLQTEEDVKLLRRSGILVSSSMTASQLTDLFERLSRLTENHQMPSDLSAICDQVLSYHNDRAYQFFRFIILWYFPNPQATFLVFVSGLLFVPTILQTIYAMIYHS
ncbi:UPF0481 protein At3g47200-like [Ananas comosus]|uniref:UPF0481 protein At3g47200-like n=1 Tax=Ananas comosus TaxID=4615 RepID=A0A6P5GYS3_ANACO|nr:UPF0481 protein At3g47200-like [Ananas comosus]